MGVNVPLGSDSPAADSRLELGPRPRLCVKSVSGGSFQPVLPGSEEVLKDDCRGRVGLPAFILGGEAVLEGEGDAEIEDEEPIGPIGWGSMGDTDVDDGWTDRAGVKKNPLPFALGDGGCEDDQPLEWA